VNLLAQAEADLSFVLEDTANGFGTSATFTPPSPGTPITLGVQFIRRGFRVDPSTGLPVAGDEAAITARLSQFSTVPVDGWTVTANDSTGTPVTYKIEKGNTMQDRTLGRITFVKLKKVDP
jgi:hypothetical protein